MGLYGALATARVSWRRVAALLDATPEVVERPGRGLARHRSAARSSSRRCRSRMAAAGRARQASASARSRARTVAIVGASGSGKSTIADLRVRLLDPDAGVVRLDGHDLRTLRLADLRRHVQSSNRSRCCSTRRSTRTSATRARTPASARSRRALDAAGLAVVRGRRCPRASARSSADRGLRAVGRRAAARRARARVPRRPVRARPRRAQRRARSGRGTADHRRLPPGHARADDDPDLAPAGPRAVGRRGDRARRRAGRRGRHAGGASRARRRVCAAVWRAGGGVRATRYELPLPSDLVRALELDAKFKDLNLGLVDGTVAAVAERRQVYRVLTTDRRDFSVIRIGPRLSRALELLP